MPLVTQLAELWTLRSGSDAVRCVASPHPLGVEVRYVINEQPLMARVLDDWRDVSTIAAAWRERLEANGWAPQAIRRRHTRH